MLNISFLASATVDLYNLIVYIVVNCENFRRPTVTLTLIRRCSISNSSKLFSYTMMCSNFMFLDQFLFKLSCKHTHTHTQTQSCSVTYMKTNPLFRSICLFVVVGLCVLILSSFQYRILAVVLID